MNHNHMSHSNNKSTKENKIFNYFKRKPQPQPTTTTTTPISTSSRISVPTRHGSYNRPPPSTTRTPAVSAFIDLTESDDNDLMIVETEPKPVDRGIRVAGSTSSTTSTTAGGFGSQGVHTQELSSTSKYKSTPTYNYEQQQQRKPVFSSLDSQATEGFFAVTTTKQRVVPVERKTVAPSGMSLTDRPMTGGPSYTLQGAGMVSARKPSSAAASSGWKRTVSTNKPSYATSYTPPSSSSTTSIKRPYSSTTTSSSSSSDYTSSSTPSSTATSNKRRLPATYYTSSSAALASLSGNPSRAGIVKGFKSISTSRKSYGSNNNNNNNNNNKSFRGSSSFGGGVAAANIRKNNSYRPPLSPEQQKVFDIVVRERHSIFFTGSAGTGKSVLLRAIIEAMKEKYPDGVAITAPTGIAACNISGSTIHSFAGIGLGQDPVGKLIEKVKNNSKAKERWKRTKVLIIDEISMVDAELFDKIEMIARFIKGSNEPFGGLQLIVTGDFFQLPPVNRFGMQRFAFESKAWSTVIKKNFMLKQVFRQKDSEFVDILNEMRLGRLSAKAIAKFKALSRKPETHSMIEPTELFPLRDQVDKSNNARLDNLPGKLNTYDARDTGDKAKVEGCIAPVRVQLKVDAQVMLLKNMDQTLVNGSLGIVVGFAGDEGYSSPSEIRSRLAPTRFQGGAADLEVDLEQMKRLRWPIVRFTDGREVLIESETWSVELPGGEVVASRTQVPLMLAWAMSIHKSQGQTLDSVRVDLGKVFEKGQAYVALSRATSLNSLQILNFDESKVQAHKLVAQFYESLATV